MDVGSVPPPAVLEVLETLANALSEAAAEIQAQGAAADRHGAVPGTAAAPLLAREGLAERLFGSLPNAPDASNLPALHVEHGAETANAQSFARPDAGTQAERNGHDAPGANTLLSGPTQALGEFALPADQLVQASLIGLQVQHAWTQQLPLPSVPPEDEPAPPPRREAHDEAAPEDEAEADAEEPEAPAEETPRDEVLDAADDDGCEVLARALQAAFLSLSPADAEGAFAGAPPAGRQKASPHAWGAGAEVALRAILDQWQRGRRVVIACPQGLDPEGPAWAFVLRPRGSFVVRPDRRLQLMLGGRRVAARLQWRQPPRLALWLHSRMAKEHQPPRGRQLAPLPGQLVLCDVQLGPVLAERRRPCEVRLRIDAVQRFWSALGEQWSVLVVICSLPLVS